MDWAKAWDFVDDLSTAIFVLGIIYALYLWFAGTLPVLLRLGNLRKRKIAVFAKGDVSGSLTALFADAGLFKAKNIIPITSLGDFGRADSATVFVVHWPDWINEFDQILAKKGDQTPLVVFAPRNGSLLPHDKMVLLDQHRHVVLTNFRGRLINDVVNSFITTAYEKR